MFLPAQSEADMHTELFGHLLAAMRFGADEAACRAAIDIAFRCMHAGHQPPHLWLHTAVPRL